MRYGAPGVGLQRSLTRGQSLPRAAHLPACLARRAVAPPQAPCALPGPGSRTSTPTPLCCRSYLDIPHLLSQSDEEEEQLPPAERQRRRQEKQRREAARRQAALRQALAGQGVVGAAPGFDPTPYQQHLQQAAAQQQQQPGFGQQQQQQFSFGQPPFGSGGSSH